MSISLYRVIVKEVIKFFGRGAGVNKIFIGMIVIFMGLNHPTNIVNINISINIAQINGVSFNLLIGYIFIVFGLSELAPLSVQFEKTKQYAQLMLAYGGGLTVILTFSNILATISPIAIGALNLSFGIITLFIIRSIITSITQLELTSGQDLNSDRLHSSWWILVICVFLPSIIVPNIGLNPFSNIAWGIAAISFIAYIYYLIMLNKTRMLFNRQDLAPAV